MAEKKTQGETDKSNTAGDPSNVASDARVGWIYLLKKGELTAELQKFVLPDTGTVDEMRRRLVLFLKEGIRPTIEPTAKAQSDTPPPVAGTSTPITTPISVGPTSLDIHRWGIQFNGKGDAPAFLERIEEIITAEKIQPERLLPFMPQLLQGEAALWFRNNRAAFITWAAFVKGFRITYFPLRYQEDLEMLISRRRQQPTEPISTYTADLQTLMRRHGGLTDEQQMTWLYRNLLPEFRQQIRRTDFSDSFSFLRIAREVEELKTEIEMTRRQQTNIEARNYKATLVNSRPTTYVANVPKNPPERRWPEKPNINPVQSRTSQMSLQTDVICWRCGEAGHYRNTCTGTPKLFCSRCGRKDTLSRDCPCQGNGRRAAP